MSENEKYHSITLEELLECPEFAGLNHEQAKQTIEAIQELCIIIALQYPLEQES